MKRITAQAVHYFLKRKVERQRSKCRVCGKKPVRLKTVVIKTEKVIKLKPDPVVKKMVFKNYNIVKRQEVSKDIYDTAEAFYKFFNVPLIVMLKSLGLVLVKKVGSNRLSRNGYAYWRKSRAS